MDHTGRRRSRQSVNGLLLYALAPTMAPFTPCHAALLRLCLHRPAPSAALHDSQSIFIDMKAKRRFQARLLTWYRRYGRDLPWRKTSDPYKILVSEVMLQQTQVDRVIPKYHDFSNATQFSASGGGAHGGCEKNLVSAWL